MASARNPLTAPAAACCYPLEALCSERLCREALCFPGSSCWGSVPEALPGSLGCFRVPWCYQGCSTFLNLEKWSLNLGKWFLNLEKPFRASEKLSPV